MDNTDDLYKAVGRRIREARGRVGKGLSQEKLAERLEVSRASIVNIEAGRQHAPLHLLWQIAEALGTDLALLLPRREELIAPETPIQLDDKMLQQIERMADGDPDFQKRMAVYVTRLKSSLEKTPMTKDTL